MFSIMDNGINSYKVKRKLKNLSSGKRKYHTAYPKTARIRAEQILLTGEYLFFFKNFLINFISPQ